jgi:dihydroxyacetone kinase-like protein
VALLVNGLGATPLMELYILNRNMADFCQAKGLRIYRTYVGEMMTSLEMAGASLTLLKLDDQLKVLLEEPANTPAFKQWRWQA